MTNKEILVETTGKFFVEPDDHGLPVLWYDPGKGDPREVASQYGHVLDPLGVDVAHEYGPLVWQVLTSVLTADKATIERVARLLWERIAYGAESDEQANEHWKITRSWYADNARAVLAALRAPADPEGGAK